MVIGPSVTVCPAGVFRSTKTLVKSRPIFGGGSIQPLIKSSWPVPMVLGDTETNAWAFIVAADVIGMAAIAIDRSIVANRG